MNRSLTRGLLGTYALLAASMLAAVFWQVGGCASDDVGYHGAVVEQGANSTLTPEQKQSILDRTARLVEQRAFADGTDFSRWKTILAKYQQRVDDAETSEQLSRVLNRALNDFGISHLDLLDPKQAKDRKEDSFGGIGVTVQAAPDAIVLTEIREDSPADKAGLRSGDRVIQIDGKSVADLMADRADEDRPLSMIRGEIGTTVNLTVERKDQPTFTVPVIRAEISKGLPPKLTMVGDDAAVLTLASFTEAYDRTKVEQLITRARERQKLIIDLRNNGGGAVSNLGHLLGLLLPPGTKVGSFVSKSDAAKYERETGTSPKDAVALAEWKSQKFRTRAGNVEPFEGQVAVLINGASASASEILAAAMRELRGAPLVGTPTAGAVLLSTYVRMEGGFEMKVPTSDYVTIKGHRLEKDPLKPDVRVFSSSRARRSVSEDPAIKAALEALSERAEAGRLPQG